MGFIRKEFVFVTVGYCWDSVFFSRGRNGVFFRVILFFGVDRGSFIYEVFLFIERV